MRISGALRNENEAGGEESLISGPPGLQVPYRAAVLHD